MWLIVKQTLLTIAAALFILASPALVHHATAKNAQVLNAVNHIRAAHGLRPLTLHPALQKAADRQSLIMAKTGRMAHTAARGYDFKSRLARVGYRGLAAENIARGQESLSRVLRGWLNSPGHRRNMLHPRMRYLGLSVARGGGKPYWTMVLGG